MTMWAPRLADRSRPIYRAIADALAEDVEAGILHPTDRLPPQRALADRLGVTLGTVTRAYAEAERRGLVESTVGRGTFVRGGRARQRFHFDAGAFPAMLAAPATSPDRSPALDSSLVDLSVNYPVEDNLGPALAPVLAQIADVDPRRLSSIAAYQAASGRDEHRASGATWLARLGLTVDPAAVVVVPGTQGGVSLAVDAVAKAGDVALTETLSWPGFMALARHRQLHVETVTMDEHGLRPDALDEAVRRTGARLLYCMSTLQNPTSVTMPEARRRDILSVAAKHALTIIEDDVYGALHEAPPPPLAALDPQRVVYVTSLSKCVAPGLRIGYLTCPDRLLDPITDVLRTTLLMASPLTAEIATRLIDRGEIDAATRFQREAARRRQSIVLQELPRELVQSSPESVQLWLGLPEPWTCETFVKAALARGVGVADGRVFTSDGHDPRAVRLSICAAPHDEALRQALRKVADLLVQRPEMARPIV